MPIVKNLTNNNIVIFNKVIEPGKSISLTNEQLDDIENLIETKQLKVEVQPVKRMETTLYKLDEKNNQQYLQIKERLIPAFFALHFNQNLTNEQLNDLIWFFKNVGPTSNLNYDTKSLLDDIQSEEELIEVLLNHLYPELIKNHFKNL